MNYLTAAETADIWRVSPRRVAYLCGTGGVSGAVKKGGAWLIPADTPKPVDGRAARHGRARPGISLPSGPAEVIAAIEKTVPRGADIPGGWPGWYGEGYFAYLRGDFERTKRCFYKIESESETVKLYACPLAMAAAVSGGDHPFFQEIEAYCKGVASAGMGGRVTAVAEWALSTAYVGAFAPAMIPKWLKDGDFSALPLPIRPAVLCLRTRYLHFVKAYESVLDVARTALIFDGPENGISHAGIYLRLHSAAACRFLGRMDDAKAYLLDVMKDCLPHGVITPFAENGPILGGLLELLLTREFPGHYDALTGLSKLVIPHWLSLHNRFTKENITTILAPQEYQVALLAVQGLSRAEIAKRQFISLSRVKNTIETVYDKLSVSNREELARHIL